jgi:two-component system, chemotaxis family, chemotaxis protein CheY
VKKVLVIDDSESVRHQVQQALSSVGYKVMEASDGIEGLDKLRGDSSINAVICDVNMPRMTGLEVAARAHAEGLTPPIVMLTSEGQPYLVRRARDAGARGWIVKPFKAEQLLAVMDKITGRLG